MYRYFCDELMKHTLAEIFLLPAVKDLDELFSPDPERDKISANLGNIDPAFILELERATGGPSARVYLSRNLLDRNAEMGLFTCAYPSISLILLRPENGLFLGIVTFNDTYYRMRAFGDSPALVLDPEGRIAGYTRRFADTMNLRDPGEILNAPLNSILAPGSGENLLRPMAATGSVAEWREAFAWKAPEDFSALFDEMGEKGGVEFEPGRDGLKWVNRSAEGYAYLKARAGLSLDGEDVRLEWEFSALEDSMANLILAGEEAFPESPAAMPPDGPGYNISRFFRFGGSGILVKDRGEEVLTLPGPGYRPGRRVRLAVEKRGTGFRLEEAGRFLGEWAAPSHLRRSGRGCFLFLRPGQKVVLHSFRALTAPATKAPAGRAGEGALSVDYRGARFDFRAAVIDSVWDTRTVRVLVLTDITDLKADLKALEKEQSRLKGLLKKPGGFIGRSPRLDAVREALPVVADSDLAVLIEGETGTGKEVLARAIHGAGPRSRGPFVKLDCASMPEGVMESELFGHEKGAFTGALSAHAGRFEQAQGGTLFLDEIGNLTPAIQARLLGVLQDLQIRRVGGDRALPLDIRVIAASNTPIRTLMEKGLFREDLYYRINQFRFELPPLRERPEDIPLLARTFLEEAAALYGKKAPRLSDAALDLLIRAPWRGNVRELRNAVMKAALFCRDEEMGPGHLALDAEGGARKRNTGPRRSRGSLEVPAEKVKAALAACAGNLNAVSRELNLSRPSVYKLLSRLKLEPRMFRNPTSRRFRSQNR